MPGMSLLGADERLPLPSFRTDWVPSPVGPRARIEA